VSHTFGLRGKMKPVAPPIIAPLSAFETRVLGAHGGKNRRSTDQTVPAPGQAPRRCQAGSEMNDARP